MREESAIDAQRGNTLRITPAHAGRIKLVDGAEATMEDHPRACGKNFSLFGLIPRTAGLPPRMREEYDLIPGSAGQLGITPAHAGRIIQR